MTDTSTKKRLIVCGNTTTGAYISVPVSQLAEVRKLLDMLGVPYSVDEITISLNDEPEVAAVNLGRGAELKAIQEMLDRQP